MDTALEGQAEWHLSLVKHERPLETGRAGRGQRYLLGLVQGLLGFLFLLLHVSANIGSERRGTIEICLDAS